MDTGLKWLRALLANGPIWLATAAWISYELALGFRPDPLGTFLAAVAVVTLGELLEVDLPGGRSTPVSNAVIFALFVVLPPVGVALAMLPAFMLGLAVKSRRIGFAPILRSTSRRLFSILLALAAYHLLIRSVPALPLGDPPAGDLLRNTMVMVWVGMLQLALDTGAAAWLTARWQKIPLRPIWRSQIHGRLAIQLSFLSVAALMALTHSVLSEWALILFMLPILVARQAFRRYSSIHRTYVQTVRALSRVPEMAGYSPSGKSAQVAALAIAIARSQGLSDNQVEEIEFASLMHDIGLISFDDPMEMKERPTRAELSEVSASLIGQTPYLTRVATIVRASNRPFVETPDDYGTMMSSQIVKSAKHFVEMTHDGGDVSPREALQQMAQDSQFDPRVVKALGRVLETLVRT